MDHTRNHAVSIRNRVVRSGLACLAPALLASGATAQFSFPDPAEPFEYFGDAVASGDFDGDGVLDLAVSVPGERVNGLISAGTVQVFRGGASGFSLSNSSIWHQGSAWGAAELESFDEFGSALASGDFDGDGYDDLAIGCPQETFGQLHFGGAVYVLYGSASGLSPAGAQRWDQNSSGIAGTVEEEDLFGSVLGAGDFDGNGCDDLVIGTPDEAVGSASRAGVVQVLYGSLGTGLTAAGSQLWFQGFAGLPGSAQPGDRFGQGLGIGDFDGDGRDDLAIGVPRDQDVGAMGSVHVIFGGSSGLTAAGNQVLAEEALVEPPPFFEQSEFGWALAAGDFNGNGRDDLAVGAPEATIWGQILAVGAVYVYYAGSDGQFDPGQAQNWNQDTPGIGGGAEGGDGFGERLTVGDFDADGVDDLVVGVPFEDIGSIRDAGAVNVIFGRYAFGLLAAGDQLLYPGAPGLAGTPYFDDWYGRALAAGDFDGDGRDDLAVGTPNDHPQGIDYAGSVHVLRGSTAGLSTSDDTILHQFTWIVMW